MSDDSPTITQQYAFAVGEDGSTDGALEPSEESVETSLETFGATVDHRERDIRIDQPEASSFGVDDRPEVTSTNGGEQGTLFADTDADQQTLTGERAASKCLFETDEADDQPTETVTDEPTHAGRDTDEVTTRAVADGGNVEDHDTDDALTPSMLAGTPVGGPGGSAACDTCNRRLTDGQRPGDPDDADPDTVHAYATRVRDTDKWTLRWVSCAECGPVGDDPAEIEDGEAHATATLAFDSRIDAFALADPQLPTHDAGATDTEPSDATPENHGENDPESDDDPETMTDGGQDQTFDPDAETVTDAWTGAFLYTSWGYGQTNVEMAQIVEVSNTGKTVRARLVSADQVDMDRGSESLRPSADQYGETFRLYVRNSGGDPAFRGSYPYINGKMDDGKRRHSFLLFDNAAENTTHQTPTNHGH